MFQRWQRVIRTIDGKEISERVDQARFVKNIYIVFSEYIVNMVWFPSAV